MSTNNSNLKVFTYGNTSYVSIDSLNNEFRMTINNDIIPIMLFCGQQFVNVIEYFNEYFEQHLDYEWLYVKDAEIVFDNDNNAHMKLKLTSEAYNLIKQDDNYTKYLNKDEQNVMIIAL